MLRTRQENNMADEDDADDGKKRVRSPKYPTVSLEMAIGRAQIFWDKEKRNTVPVPVAVKHWGYQSKSSGGMKTVAALINFGLMDDKGSGDERKVFLTDAAMRILLDTRADSSERWRLIREAALKPKIYQDVLANYPAGLPSDDTLRHFLIFDKEFNEDAVDGFIKDFRATLVYAKLGESGSVEALTPDTRGKPSPVKVGDLIQWESNGVNQFEAPRKVRAVHDQDGQAWVFVEGSTTGLPLKETILIQAVNTSETKPLIPPVLPEDKQVGEKEWLRGSLTAETSYRLFISGDLGPKEIGKLIKLLKAQKAVLTDDDEEAEED
jgi:hypothetical protein